MEAYEYEPIGRIVDTHGIKGRFRILSYTDNWEVFQVGRKLLISDPKGDEKEYTIDWFSFFKRRPLISFEGVDDYDKAYALVRSDLLINKSDLEEPGDDEYFWFDLVGLQVFSTEKDYLGNIDSIIQTKSNDVFVVKHPEKDEEKLIPALKTVVLEVDLEKKKMRVRLPGGL